MKYRDGKNKYILRQVLSNYIPTHFFDRPKQGFRVPIFEWLKGDWIDMFNYYLSDQKLKNIPYLNLEGARNIKDQYLLGCDKEPHRAWYLFVLSMWSITIYSWLLMKKF